MAFEHGQANLDTGIGNHLSRYWIEFIDSFMPLLRCIANKWSSACEWDASLEIRS